MKLNTWRFEESGGLTFPGLPWPKSDLLLSAQAVVGQPARSMQIEDVELYPFNVPCREPFRMPGVRSQLRKTFWCG